MLQKSVQLWPDGSLGLYADFTYLTKFLLFFKRGRGINHGNLISRNPALAVNHVMASFPCNCKLIICGVTLV